MFFHMARVFLFGAYKYPRELNWIIGVLLLAHRACSRASRATCCRGTRRAYWATVVGININGTAPFVGPFLAHVPARRARDRRATRLRASTRCTCSLLPGAIFALIGLHLYLVDPPRRLVAAVVEGSRGRRAASPRPRRQRGRADPAGPPREAGRGRAHAELSRSTSAATAFQRYKEDVKKRGKPFFPYAMFHDTVMSLVVVRRDRRARGHLEVHDPGDHPARGGLARAAVQRARPTRGRSSFVPRPDWYFYFLFYLLRIFKWPDSVILGTVGIPTICMMLLLALPFIDLRRERRLSRRPVAIVAAILAVLSMGVLTYKGATAKEALGGETDGAVPTWAKKQGFADNRRPCAGAKLFAAVGLPAAATRTWAPARRTSARPT